MNSYARRLAKVRAQVNALFPESAPPSAEELAREALWQAQATRWLERLIDSMAPNHYPLLRAWLEDRNGCRHATCPVPPGLERHLGILRGWIGQEDRPIALPPAVVEVYLAGTPATTPHEDCEDCGYPCPVTGFFAAPTTVHFPLCPLCQGVTGWHAWDIKHGSPGYQGLTPYGER
jgi:hypothetical protein